MLQAGEHVVLPWQLRNGDYLLVAVLDGWWDDTPYATLAHKPGSPGYDGLGKQMFSGTPGYTWTNPTDPAPTENHMAVLTCYTATESPYFVCRAGNGPLTIEDIDPTAKYAWLMPNTDASFRYGAQHVRVHLYATACEEICEAFDFLESDNGFHIEEYGENTFIGGIGCDYGGEWIDGEGFKTTFRDDLAHCGVYANEVGVSKVLESSIAVCKVKITYTWSGTHSSGDWPMSLYIYYGNGDYAGTQNVNPMTAGEHLTHEFTVDVTIDRIAILMLESYSAGVEGWIEKVELFCS